MSVTAADAIWDAFAALGGDRSIREVTDWIEKHHPGRWKAIDTSMADLVLGGNPTSPYKPRQQFLERTGRGMYRMRPGAARP